MRQVPAGASRSGKPFPGRWLRLLFAVSLVVMLAAGVLIWVKVKGSPAVVPTSAEQPSLSSQGPAPDFELTNQEGQRVSLSDFRGRVVLMTFFYSSCPDFCPLMNFNFKQIWGSLDEPSRGKMVLLSITFDPEFDTPEILNKYAKERGFDVPGWHFLTGTPDEIKMVTDEYGVVYQLVPAEEHVHPDGEVHHHSRAFNHLAQALLIDQAGEVRGAYLGAAEGTEVFSPPLIVKDIYALLGRR